MSVLELNGRVFDASTTGTLTLTGEGSATTDVTQGLAKSWINLNGTGTVAIRDSQNVASLTDNETGDYSSTFSNNMTTTNYATFVSDGGRGDCTIATSATSSQAIHHYATDGNSSSDEDLLTQSIFGDLA